MTALIQRQPPVFQDPQQPPVPAAAASIPLLAQATPPRAGEPLIYTVSMREPTLATPKCFEGDFDLCKVFIAQCEIAFKHQPSKYRTQDDMIAFIVSHLGGKALKWAVAAIERDSNLSHDYAEFCREFKFIFDHPSDGPDAAARLHAIQQGSRSVADYTVEFKTLAAQSGWGDKALMSAYKRGLSRSIKEWLMKDRPTSYSELVRLALDMDDCLREERYERNQERGHRPSSSPRTSPTSGWSAVASSSSQYSSPPTPSSAARPSGEEPMQIGRSRLTPAQREQRMRDKLCLYCGRSGHFVGSCPTRPGEPKDQAH